MGSAPATVTALYVTARRFPVRHGFTLRQGGVSVGKRASLDVGPATAAPADALENRRRLAAAAGFSPERLVLAEQVHGARVVRGVPGEVAEADALWTDAPDTWLGIRTADCVPLLLARADGAVVAAVHSGWRGTEARIAEAAVASLAAAGAPARDLVAAIGPCIGPCCYEVGPELGERFAGAFGADVAPRGPAPGARPHLDLRLAVRRTLVQAGVPDASIEDVPGCTACDAGAFFSHRRDQGGSGRHLAFIATRGGAPDPVS